MGRPEATLRAEDALLGALADELGVDDDVVATIEVAARDSLEVDRVERAKVWLAALERVRPDHPAIEELADAVEERDLAARAADPARLFELDPERARAALDRAGDPAATLRAAIASATDLDAALAALGPLARGELGPVIAEAVARRADEVTRGEALLELAARAREPGARARLADAAYERLRDGDDPAAAALALARAGAVRRDTAMLRAALTAAEKAGARGVARQIVDLALDVVGHGPARAALEAVRKRLEE